MSGLEGKPYGGIVAFMEQLFSTHGDTPAGMGWTASDEEARYQAILDVVRDRASPHSLLDFGCGSARLLEYLRRTERDVGLSYTGLDVSADAIALCRKKFPDVDFIQRDVLDETGSDWPRFDYVVMNGVLTYKGDLAWHDMFEYMKKLLAIVFAHARTGVAFNVVSKQVDWERDDLFHVPMDVLADFLSSELSRHFVIRADYGLYEYTVHLHRTPVRHVPGKDRSLVRRNRPMHEG